MTRAVNVGTCLAIDFGTTATAAAISARGREQLIEIDGSPRMPSIVCWKAPTDGHGGRLLLGEAAENEAALAPHCVERCPKRKLGQEHILLGHARVRVTDAVAQIFLHVLAEARALEGGRTPEELRLTHPAQWGHTKLEKLRDAAAAAGFPEANLLPEPVGAAVYFADERLEQGQHVAVYDLGGGTFDTAVLLRTGEGFDVAERPGGREDLGGEDFDDRLYRFLARQLDPEQWQTLTSADADLRWQRAHHDFRREVRRAKERLSKYADATVRSPLPGTPDLRVSRTEFESLVRDDVVETIDELERTIEASGQSVQTLAAIYLAGGSSRVPIVSTLIEERFGRVPSVLGDPKAVIALGAARAHSQRRVSGPRAIGSPGIGISSGSDATPPRPNPAPVEQIVVRPEPAALTGPPVRHSRRVEPRSQPTPARVSDIGRRSNAQVRGLSDSPRARTVDAATATGIIAGSGVLAAVASVLLLLDATKSGAGTGIRVALNLGVVGWLLVAGGFGTASASFLGVMRDRVAGLRAAALVVSGGFGLAFLSEVVNAVAYAGHGARGTFVAGHGAYGLGDLLAATAAVLAAAALARSRGKRDARGDALLRSTCSVAGASLLMFAAASILHLVSDTSRAVSAAVSGGIGLEIAGGALAAGGALIAATAFLPAEAGASALRRRRQVLAAGACVAALGLGIVALGSGTQAAAAGAGELGVRTTVAGWLATGRQACWALALCAAALVADRRI